MSDQAANSTSPWSDQFATPSLEELVGALEEPFREAFSAVLDALSGRKGCKTRVQWLGLPWRWTIVCAQTGLDHPELAYLVPVPGGPVVCVPVPIEGPDSPDLGGLTKPVRQVLERSAIISGYLWAEWPVNEIDLVAIAPLLDSRTVSTGV